MTNTPHILTNLLLFSFLSLYSPISFLYSLLYFLYSLFPPFNIGGAVGPGPLNALKRQRDRSGGGAGPGRKRKDQSLKVTAAGGLDGQDPTMLLYQVRHMCHICHIRHMRHIRHIRHMNREAYHDLTTT